MSLAVGPELKFACPSVIESSSAPGPSGPNPLVITSVAKSAKDSALRRSNSACVAWRHWSNLSPFSSSLWPNIGDMQPPKLSPRRLPGTGLERTVGASYTESTGISLRAAIYREVLPLPTEASPGRAACDSSVAARGVCDRPARGHDRQRVHGGPG